MPMSNELIKEMNKRSYSKKEIDKVIKDTIDYITS